ncbi:MAG: M15 family metallopeptidase [Paenisporosarcina sp.]
MKRFISIVNIVFLLVLGGLLFVWIDREIEYKRIREARPLPSSLHKIVEEKSGKLVENADKLGIPILITDGFRSVESQNEIYGQGRTSDGSIVTYAKGGESYHNYGLAIDFALLNKDGSVSYDLQRDTNGNGEADWFEVARLGKDLGFTWGGDWRGFKDYPHFEYTLGLSIHELQNGWRLEDKIEEK